jgi:hypothetical protein
MISSEYKNSQKYFLNHFFIRISILLSLSHNPQTKPINYYCPTENLKDIFQLLRYQNEEKQFSKPLMIYSNICDGLDATDLNVETNQFCLLRVNIFSFCHCV